MIKNTASFEKILIAMSSKQKKLKKQENIDLLATENEEFAALENEENATIEENTQDNTEDNTSYMKYVGFAVLAGAAIMGLLKYRSANEVLEND